MNSRVAVIGTGNMGGAFAEALSRLEGIELCVYDSHRPSAEAVANRSECGVARSESAALSGSAASSERATSSESAASGGSAASSGSATLSGSEKVTTCGRRVRVLSALDEAKGSHIVIIAVKPQVLPTIYDNLATLRPDFFISIAGGVTVETLVSHLKTDKVARFMPNIAAKVGSSVTAVTYSGGLSTEERAEAMRIALSVGSAFELDENLFGAFIGLSGSGIAYMFDMMHYMAMGGVREGIPYPKALAIVADTMLSAANLQRATGKNAIELETMVCSAKGITIEGVAALAESGFGSALMNAVSVAAKKSEEMEGKK